LLLGPAVQRSRSPTRSGPARKSQLFRSRAAAVAPKYPVTFWKKRRELRCRPPRGSDTLKLCHGSSLRSRLRERVGAKRPVAVSPRPLEGHGEIQNRAWGKVQEDVGNRVPTRSRPLRTSDGLVTARCGQAAPVPKPVDELNHVQSLQCYAVQAQPQGSTSGSWRV